MKELDTLSCLQVNSTLKAGKKYIYGTDNQAAKLFLKLISLNIEIEGFIGKKELEGEFLFRKPIYSKDVVEQERDVQVLTTNSNALIKNGVICKIPIELNNKINRKNVVIFGAGVIGLKIKKYLEKEDVNIKSFIDNDISKIGTVIEGIEVCSKDILAMLPTDTSIVIAGKRWREIDHIVKEENSLLDRFIEDGYLLEVLECNERVIVDYEKRATLSIFAMFNLYEHYPDRTIIMYGADVDLLNRYAQTIRLFGYDDIVLAVDYIEKKSNEAIEFPLIDIADILYRDKYIVVLTSMEKESRLIELGLKETIDYTYVNVCNKSYYRKSVLDANLGYTYLGDNVYSKYTGVYVHGSEKENDYKIAVLGGSNSDSGRESFLSWVEVLLKDYMKNDVTIYNYAVSGYSTGHELIKMIRDVIPMKPDLIISYSGCNDVFQNGTPSPVFAFSYLYEIFKAKNKNVVYGIENKVKAYEKWLKNVQYMNAVAEVNGILFIAFIQPLLPSKMNFTLHEKKMMITLSTLYDPELIIECKQMREKAKSMEEENAFIYDLSNIFDNDDVYMDISHVYEEGNKIIADQIWNIIKDKVPQKVSDRQKKT